jgi:pimeloyl-ACP methyl ester carboxylesterase
LGWGASDKPAGYPYTAANQTGDLDAVIAHLGLDRPVLVAHDASGPPAIDWALDNPERVAALVLLNTYYGWMPSLRPPEAILLFSLPLVRNLARWAVVHSDALDRRLYTWQVGRFISDPGDRREVVSQLYEQFRAERPAFFSLNADLLGTTISRRKRFAEMRSFAQPVRIIFGAADPYLNAGVAKRFHRLFPTSKLVLLPNARHYVQIDDPVEVARLILSVRTSESHD